MVEKFESVEAWLRQRIAPRAICRPIRRQIKMMYYKQRSLVRNMRDHERYRHVVTRCDGFEKFDLKQYRIHLKVGTPFGRAYGVAIPRCRNYANSSRLIGSYCHLPPKLGVQAEC